jgi:glycosyltransferase involved in cell wall biosynthesis
MVSKLNIADKPYVIIEGFADGQSPIKEKIFKKKNGKRIVMYAGTLNRRYGIGNLIESFAYIKNDCYELWLCGSGDYDSDINAIAEKDKRIKHYGVLNNERVVELEGCADILINPRPTNEEYTKFSFPSKNLEYMSTGVPLLTTKLPGMPAEYDDYVFFIEDESPAGIADAILKVGRLSDDELFNFGQKAQSFIYGHKNYHMQGAKILELMSRVL